MHYPDLSLTSIRQQSYAKVPDRYLSDGDPSVFAICVSRLLLITLVSCKTFWACWHFADMSTLKNVISSDYIQLNFNQTMWYWFRLNFKEYDLLSYLWHWFLVIILRMHGRNVLKSVYNYWPPLEHIVFFPCFIWKKGKYVWTTTSFKFRVRWWQYNWSNTGCYSKIDWNRNMQGMCLCSMRRTWWYRDRVLTCDLLIIIFSKLLIQWINRDPVHVIFAWISVVWPRRHVFSENVIESNELGSWRHNNTYRKFASHNKRTHHGTLLLTWFKYIDLLRCGEC